jgi:trk system potassium uptake protein TrkA
MKIVIVGCGRVGAQLAGDFSAGGHEVTTIDVRQQAFRHLPPDFAGKEILGTGIDEDVLRSAGIEEADVFIAVTDDDNTNIMAAQIARVVYTVPHVVLRIYDSVRADIYRQLGLTTICPTRTVAGVIEEQVLGVGSTTEAY